MPRAVILTALPVEYLAVRTHLTDLQEQMHPQGTIYERGNFVANGQSWEVGIAEVGAGNAGAAVEAERAIAYFKPDILFFVGIAGGIKDVAIGDVVAATDVYGYESGKAEEHRFLARPKAGKSAYALVQRAKSEARKGDWLQRLTNSLTLQPRVFVAPIVAGEKVVVSKQSDVFNFIRVSYNDAIAVEMEGFGFLSAAFAYPDIKAIVIRGISDLVEGKNDDSIEPEQVRQERASHHASAFAFEILSKLEITSQDLRESDREPTISNMNIQQKQRLEQRQDTLQSEWNLRNDKLKKLRQALAIDSGVAVKFQLKQQIEDEETQLQQLASELDTLDRDLHPFENDSRSKTDNVNSLPSNIQIQPTSSIEVNESDLTRLADILKRSGRVNSVNSRRALCISIQIDPADLDFIEIISPRDFAIQLVSQLQNSHNFLALCNLCNRIVPAVPGFKTELDSIKNNLNCKSI
jgi:nucleoside phosphorylase